MIKEKSFNQTIENERKISSLKKLIESNQMLLDGYERELSDCNKTIGNLSPRNYIYDEQVKARNKILEKIGSCNQYEKGLREKLAELEKN